MASARPGRWKVDLRAPKHKETCGPPMSVDPTNPASQRTRSPFGAWPGKRNVLTSSASPQTVIPVKRLYHGPFGTSGSPSSQAASSSSCLASIRRSWTRSRRCWSRRGGTSLRRTWGTSDAVEAAGDPLLQAGGLARVARGRELLGQQTQLASAEHVAAPLEVRELRRL